MVSIIIPSYREIYLLKTIRDLLEKARGDIEIILHVDRDADGIYPETIKDKRLHIVKEDKPKGMRYGINYGLSNAKGEYIMKVDAHCVFSEGYDLELQKNMQENWLVIPRRYALHAERWDRVTTLPIKDYHYLSWAGVKSDYGYCMHVGEWKERTLERMNKPQYDIDDTMMFQGSCWFANRDYFMKRVGYLDDDPNKYSTFSGEQLEVGLKYALGGGEVKVNKKLWYAHLFKNKRYYGGVETQNRDYKRDLKNRGGYEWATKHWMNNEEPGMVHKFDWLVDKYWPLPGWPENWREIYYGRN